MGRFFRDSDDKLAEARLEQVLEAIKCKDKTALQAVFSTKSLAEANDFDKSVNDLFELFQGEVVSWARTTGPIADTSYEFGHVTKKLKTDFTIETDKQKYIFFILDYTSDDNHPDNVGVYQLWVLKFDDLDKVHETGGNGDHAGIYIPK